MPTPVVIGTPGSYTDPAILIGNGINTDSQTDLLTDNTLSVSGVLADILGIANKRTATTTMLAALQHDGSLAVAGSLLSSNLLSGAGVPTAVAPAGSLYLRTDSPSNGPRLYQTLGSGVWLSIESGLAIFNVKDYGAVGDGSTDDHLALQAAIDAAVVVSGIVYLPSGTYKITTTLNVNGSCAFVGITTDTFAPPTIAPTAANFTKGVFYCNIAAGTTQLTGLSFSGFQIAGPATGGGTVSATNGYAFWFQHCQHVRVTNIGISNTSNGVFIDNSGDVQLLNVSFNPYAATTMQPGSRFGFKALGPGGTLGNANLAVLINCSVSEGTTPTKTRRTSAFVQQNGYQTFILINCGATNAHRGFWSTAGVGGIAPNYFVSIECGTDNCTLGLILDDGAVATIDGCNINRWIDDAAIKVNFAGGIATISNSFLTSSNLDIGTAQSGIAILGSAGASITGGAITNVFRGEGLVIGTSGRVTVAGLLVSNTPGGAGVHITSSFTGFASITGTSLVQQVTATFGFSVDDAATGRFTITGCDVSASSSIYSYADNPIATKSPGRVWANNGGINPQVFPTQPAVPSSNVPFTNLLGFNCSVYASVNVGIGHQITSITLTDPGGHTYVVPVPAPFQLQSGLVKVPIGFTITIVYSGTLSWQWIGN